MSKKAINIGDKYGDYIVIQDLGVNKSRHHYFECKCQKCNKIIKVTRQKLLSDNPYCLEFKKCKYLGKEIEGYVVESVIGKAPSKHLIYKCVCKQCKRSREFTSRQIQQGIVKPCNCQKLKLSKKFVDQLLY